MTTDTMQSAPLTIQRAPRSLRARILRTAVMLVIFVGGGVAGYCVGTMQLLEFDTPASTISKEPDKFTEFLLAHLKKDLSLTETQYPQVETIVLLHHEAFNKLRDESQKAFAKEMAKMDVEMFGVLDESQEKLWKTRMERMRGHWRRPSSGGSSRRDKGDRDKSGSSKSDGGKSGSERSPRDSKGHDHEDHRRPELDKAKAAARAEAEPAKPAN